MTVHISRCEGPLLHPSRRVFASISTVKIGTHVHSTHGYPPQEIIDHLFKVISEPLLLKDFNRPHMLDWLMNIPVEFGFMAYEPYAEEVGDGFEWEPEIFKKVEDYAKRIMPPLVTDALQNVKKDEVRGY
ncbi:hypothetical protein DXG03_004414 [Asterophora parasitica]|uniref:Uncharacterized protein n=1 Tax=Asterophora parasitica TaxID=117018 RepID=A0A9P7FWI3_9AGAR|nr:hypothetical protein DXG03_004414 [Asterophora parasitica]